MTMLCRIELGLALILVAALVLSCVSGAGRRQGLVATVGVLALAGGSALVLG